MGQIVSNESCTALVLAGVFVMLMQAGFALVIAGLCRAKNAAQVISMNLFIFALSVFGFWVCGFALLSGGWAGEPMNGTPWFPVPGGYSGTPVREWAVPLFGHPFGLMGTSGFFMSWGGSSEIASSLFFWQAAALALAAVIPAGVMAERWRFGNVVLYGAFAAAIPLAIFGHWVWGGGWLAQLGENLGLGHGYVDFAGSSVLHAAGAMIGLMGATALGPRLGKYTRDGKPRPIAGHNLAYVVAGNLVLAAGWLGLTVGPSLLGGGGRAPVIAVNTVLASVAGAVAAGALVKVKFRKPDPSLVCNGLLAGCVAISASCPFVNSVGAVITGAVAGLLAVQAVLFFEGTMKVDDPMGALAVHGVGGVWGVLSLGLLADGSYGFNWNGVEQKSGVAGAFATLFGGPSNDWSQLMAQVIGALSCLIFFGLAAWLWFKVSNRFAPMRTRREDELAGLDLPEVGAECYPDFHLTDKNAPRQE